MVFVIMDWFDFGVKMFFFFNYFYITQIIENLLFEIFFDM